MGIIDIFSFNGEMDTLELRLNILNDVVDEFIICESDKTFTGNSKPLYFKENKERYSRWSHKIKHFTMASDDAVLLEASDLSPGVPGGQPWWNREFTQKESMRYALTHLKDEDVVFIGDADEIWNPSNYPTTGRWKMEQLVYAYYLNNRSSEWWEGTSVMPYSEIKKDTLDNLRAHDVHREYMRAPTFKNGGWHFTNMGGVDFIKRKLNSYSHQEFNNPTIINNLSTQLESNKDFIGRDFKFWTDESEWPEFLKRNKAHYQHLCKE